ncbi:MAG: sulfite exporter TauE/SafE family protein [Acidobacteria bacterium]|nr:sulfite exporter TauE/SafE family protein [Acidobacteriota bacterium]
MFELVLALSAVAGGAIAGVTGFGIGSLLTPALAWQVDARLAVAAVSIPHVIGTAFRFWLLGGRIDRRVLGSFGVMSAAGGLTGALIQAETTTPILMVIFGILLLFSAAAELTGLGQRMRFEGPVAYLAGALSGLLGGLVGNQGGIRSAALLGVDLPKHAFVGTATAVGLMVDGARVHRVLVRVPERSFRRIVAVLLALLGATMLAEGIRG